jgi:hypothetical protein
MSAQLCQAEGKMGSRRFALLIFAFDGQRFHEQD